MVIKARFRIYEHMVCDDNRTLYQLEHFKNRRTFPFKKLTYNKDRKAYRIYGQWVTKKRLRKLMVLVKDEMPEGNLSDLEMLIKKLTYWAD